MLLCTSQLNSLIILFMKKFWYACMMPSPKCDEVEHRVFVMTCRCIQPHETGETSATSAADAYYHGALSG